MKKNWWKYLTVILLLYTLVFSFYIPLKPGLLSAENTSLTAGNTSVIRVTGYNTSFSTNDEINAWILTADSTTVCAGEITVISGHEIEFPVSVPENISANSYDLFVASSHDQKMVLPTTGYISSETKSSSEVKGCEEKNSLTLQPATHALAFPNRPLLYESIRNLMFHVPMWFAMMLIMGISLVFSILYLSSFDMKHDIVARQSISVGIFLGILGLATGSLWARYTWGQWWVNDAKLNGAAITTLVYLAYAVLRGSINEEQQRARIAAVYNIFAFVIMMVMLMVLPRMADSLHPGNGGNPAFSSYDLDSILRMIFYPAVLGWMGLSLWLMQIKIRIDKIENPGF